MLPKAEFKIYGLRNPIDGNFFYVGCTIGALRSRLMQHVGSRAGGAENSITMIRSRYIESILAENEYPVIELLEIVDFDGIDEAECRHYLRLQSEGYSLFQSKYKFNYTKNSKVIF